MNKPKVKIQLIGHLVKFSSEVKRNDGTVKMETCFLDPCQKHNGFHLRSFYNRLILT